MLFARRAAHRAVLPTSTTTATISSRIRNYRLNNARFSSSSKVNYSPLADCLVSTLNGDKVMMKQSLCMWMYKPQLFNNDGLS